MAIPIFQVDAFTDRAFTGNPAAVCLLEHPADAAWMQSVAAEMNLSETAFVLPGDDLNGLRWFTPGAEVALCGHATLATSHVLWTETGAEGPLRFSTKSGILTAERHGNLIALDFPSNPPSPIDPPAGLREAVRIDFDYCGKSRNDLLITVEDESIVRALKPDFPELARLDLRGLIVSAPSTSSDFDFVSRFFAPGIGIDEDPVTGSAHCCLAPFWAEKLGRTKLRAFQASQRGGQIETEVLGDRVSLRGPAVTVFWGKLLV